MLQINMTARPVYFESAGGRDNLGDHVKMCTTAEDASVVEVTGHKSI